MATKSYIIKSGGALHEQLQEEQLKSLVERLRHQNKTIMRLKNEVRRYDFKDRKMMREYRQQHIRLIKQERRIMELEGKLEKLVNGEREYVLIYVGRDDPYRPPKTFEVLTTTNKKREMHLKKYTDKHPGSVVINVVGRSPISWTSFVNNYAYLKNFMHNSEYATFDIDRFNENQIKQLSTFFHVDKIIFDKNENGVFRFEYTPEILREYFEGVFTECDSIRYCNNMGYCICFKEPLDRAIIDFKIDRVNESGDPEVIVV